MPMYRMVVHLPSWQILHPETGRTESCTQGCGAGPPDATWGKIAGHKKTRAHVTLATWPSSTKMKIHQHLGLASWSTTEPVRSNHSNRLFGKSSCQTVRAVRGVFSTSTLAQPPCRLLREQMYPIDKPHTLVTKMRWKFHSCIWATGMSLISLLCSPRIGPAPVYLLSTRLSRVCRKRLRVWGLAPCRDTCNTEDPI